MKRSFPWTGLAIGVAVIALAVLFQNQMYVAILKASGRSERCPWRSALRGLEVSVRQNVTRAELAKSFRILRREADLELVSTPQGEIWIPAGSSQEIANDMAEQERGIYSPWEYGVKQGDVVLDCGANIGLFTREALKRGAALVVAIEPVPQNVECLKRNLAKEIAEGKVSIAAKGVWNQDDFLEMSLDAENGAAHSFVLERAQGAHKVRLPLTTIDKLADELVLSRVDFIKMDIEGAERKAVQGARRTLQRFKPRLALCVYHLADDPEAIPAGVAQARTDYRHECGPCLAANGRLNPEVQFYY
jgi:FkbM family methyltransferase